MLNLCFLDAGPDPIHNETRYTIYFMDLVHPATNRVAAVVMDGAAQTVRHTCGTPEAHVDERQIGLIDLPPAGQVYLLNLLGY